MPPPDNEVEKIAEQIHDLYQAEAKNQGDVRHKDSYAELPENVKEFDRLIARFVIEERADARLQALRDVDDEVNDYFYGMVAMPDPQASKARILKAISSLLKPKYWGSTPANGHDDAANGIKRVGAEGAAGEG